MRLLSITQFANEIGISRPAISKALKLGKLRIAAGGGNHNDEKFIDIDSSDSKAYLENRKGKKSRGPKKKKEKPRKPSIKEKLEIIKPIDPLPEIRDSEEVMDSEGQFFMGSGDAQEKIRLECKKKEKEIEKLDIDNSKKRGDLIDKSLIKLFIMKIYNIDVNQFLQLEDILTNKICSITGISAPDMKVKISQSIKTDLYKTQSYIQREVDKFLDELEKDGIKKVG